MRLHDRAGIARALYFAHIGRRLCVVRVFLKKTQQTPRREIELALRRVATVEVLVQSDCSPSFLLSQQYFSPLNEVKRIIVQTMDFQSHNFQSVASPRMAL